MALYTEKSYKDISEDWERIQALEKQKKEREEQEKAQRAYEEQQRRAQANSQAQAQQKKGGLEGILAGIGESLGNVGHTVYNMFGNGLASIGDLTSSIVEGRQITDRSDGWKEHMKGVYGDKNMSDKDYYNRTGGKALDAAATVSEFIPGVGVAGAASKAGTTAGKVAGQSAAKNLALKTAINVGQGAASGIGQQYANNGENVTLEDALKAGAIGAASGGVSTMVGSKLGSMAAKSPAKGAIGKAVQSNIGRSAITGATSGATGGALGSAMYGGDILQGALEGAGNGALGGATTSAIYGAIGAGGRKLFGIDDGTPKTKVAQTEDDNITPGQKRRQTPMDWGENDISGQAKKKNYAQKLGRDLQDVAEITRDNAIYGKLKGNTAQEMVNKDAINNLRKNYGYTPDDYAEASKLSTAINKWYDNEIQSSGADKVNRQLQDNLALPTNNTLPEKYEKAYLETINNALSMANAGDSDVIDKYSAAGLERAAKYLGEQEQHQRRTSFNGVDGRVDGDRSELADYYKKARQVLRNEVDSMIELDDYTKGNLEKLLDNAGATPQAKKAILSAKNFSEVKAATSPLEDARTMQSQMRSSALKRSAAGDRSASFTTQTTNAMGVNDLVGVAAKPVRGLAAGVENAAGKVVSGIGNALAGDGATGKVASGVKNFASAIDSGLDAGMGNWKLSDDAKYFKSLKNDTPITLGSIANDRIARQAGINEANNRLIDQRQAETRNKLDKAEANYNTALANYQAAEAQAQQVQSQGAAQLQQISDAMNAAMAAGDFNAYSQLANLYKQAYSIYGSELEAANKSNEAKALTATQAKALTGLQQVEALENMTPDLGAKLSQTPLSFLVNLGGGNEYANQSQSLALTLGYLQSGANITPREAENIGKSYIPSPYDSEEVRRNKLARARQLLQNYLGDTTALEQ